MTAALKIGGLWSLPIRVTSIMGVLPPPRKHVPSRNMFQIGMMCRSEKCAFLIHTSDWHCTSSHRSRMLIARSLSIKICVKRPKVRPSCFCLFVWFLFSFFRCTAQKRNAKTGPLQTHKWLGAARQKMAAVLLPVTDRYRRRTVSRIRFCRK